MRNTDILALIVGLLVVVVVLVFGPGTAQTPESTIGFALGRGTAIAVILATAGRVVSRHMTSEEKTID
jgi:hypothetical protein